MAVPVEKQAPKTAQSVPRKFQGVYAGTMNAKQVMNMSLTNQNPVAFELARSKANLFLPFTGVDQAFLINRPFHTRQCMEIKEKLNELTHKMISTTVNNLNAKTILFDRNRQRLVYDNTFSQNQPMEDRDCRLYVPPMIRKANGGHINEKISKYYERLGKFYSPTGQSDNTLVFESRFESGNLGRATQIGEFVYDLELRSDFTSLN